MPAVQGPGLRGAPWLGRSAVDVLRRIAWNLRLTSFSSETSWFAPVCRCELVLYELYEAHAARG